jgi:hypothetical protein
MESKVDPILNLTAAGRQVSGSGPITKWKNREVRAMVTFVVVQPQPTGVAANPGRLVVAAGASDWFPKGAANWWAAGGVLASDPPLVAGPAVAYARALIQYDANVLEPYDWEVFVVLQ